MLRTISLLATIVLCCAVGFAQTTSTSILGTVTDPTGAAVAGAKVTAKNVATGVSSVTQTTGTGDYLLPLLNVGDYEVTVEFSGFKVETKGGIHLQVN